MRKVGWVLVGVGSVTAIAGHYVAYSTTVPTHSSTVAIAGAAVGLGLVLLGLLVVQLRS